MQRWQVGAVTVTKIVEIEMPSSIRGIVPLCTREALLTLPWLQPHFCNAEGRPIMSLHSFVVESEGLRILVDTCVGNDKSREVAPWNMRSGPFLADLTAAGFAPESIDRVVCTHLHVDHVGWNTRLSGERWVPTFANARYLFGRAEYAHWSQEHDASSAQLMADSVQPILDAGLCDLVDSDHRITENVWLEPTPGHTPGHVCVRIRSEYHEAVITGDLMHHPIQCAHPDWPSAFDSDPEMARRTRHAFLARHAETPTLILGTHFATPTAGHIVRDGDAYRLVTK